MGNPQARLAPLGAQRSRCVSQDPNYGRLKNHLIASTGLAFYADREQLLAALIVGGGLGWAIDTYLLNTGPWALVVGLILGALAGVRNAYRMAQRWPN